MSVIQLKRGLSANFGAVSLLSGEAAFLTDTGKFYVGNGTENVLINPDIAPVSSAAVKLETARTLNVSGTEFVSTGAQFDGTANATIQLALAESGVVAGTYPKVTVNAKGIVTGGTSLTADDIPIITMSKISDAGTVAGLNTGIEAGNIPVLGADGKLNNAVLPALAIVETFVVADATAMVALEAQQGDIAIRNDVSKTFILSTNDPTVEANWLEMKSPTDVVTSVAGRTGAVVLTASDVGLENVTNESKATMFTNPEFTGIPVAPTATVDTNTNQIATTAYVKSQGYLTASSTIDGGTF